MIEAKLRFREGPLGCVVERAPGLIVRWDAEGRWGTFRRDERIHRRTLSGEVLLHGPGGPEPLDPAAADEAHRAAWETARDLAAALDGDARFAQAAPPGGPDRLRACLRRALAWPPARLREEAARFRAAYPEPIPVLPPERYRDAVVLPALGCPFNRCTFCTLHRDTAWRVFSESELDEHLRRVVSLLGESVRARPGVFLGSGSALSLPQRRLTGVLRRVAEVLGPPARNAAAFLDADHAPVRSAADWSELAGLGLRRAVIGLETGSPELRRELGKSPSLGPTRSAVAALRQTGIACGLSVLVGPGGVSAAERHRRETVAVVRDCGLGPDDRVYLSRLLGHSAGEGLVREEQALHQDLAAATRARVVAYGLGRFHYWA